MTQGCEETEERLLDGGPSTQSQTGQPLCYNRIHTPESESTAGLEKDNGTKTCRSPDVGDVTDRVGVTAPIEGAPMERATEELLLALAREIMLVSENASCKLICEVFRVSLPVSFMRGLNILITCCKIELDRGRRNLKVQSDNTFISAKLSSKDNWHSGQLGCLGDSL